MISFFHTFILLFLKHRKLSTGHSPLGRLNQDNKDINFCLFNPILTNQVVHGMFILRRFNNAKRKTE
jgi:hypothetical protein